MRKVLFPEEVDQAKIKIKALLKANAEIESLTDQELYVLGLMVEKELHARESRYARRGVDPARNRI